MSKPDEVQQRTTTFHVYEKVDIALGAIVAASHRAEEAHVARAVMER